MKTISNIIEFKGKIYVVTQDKNKKEDQSIVQELSLQGKLGRQLHIKTPVDAERGAELVSNGNKLFLIGTAAQGDHGGSSIAQVITGNESFEEISREITWGNQGPTLSLIGDHTITIQQNGEWVEEGWTASDAEDGLEEVSVTSPIQLTHKFQVSMNSLTALKTLRA